jgi:hypothetical protein
MAAFRVVTPPPPPVQKVVLRARIKRAINHAMLICPNFEDTVECKLAWEEVEELTQADRKVPPKKDPYEEMCEADPKACLE